MQRRRNECRCVTHLVTKRFSQKRLIRHDLPELGGPSDNILIRLGFTWIGRSRYEGVQHHNSMNLEGALARNVAQKFTAIFATIQRANECLLIVLMMHVSH